jgi:phthalate 4,5-cis-dihydrodiol dehydrogenase
MAKKLRIGIAGLGRGFTVMLPTFLRDPRVALVAAADLRREARARFATEFNAHVYESVAELCADPTVEVIYVATPHQLHAEHAILAAQAGKHLLVEKPMTISTAECRAMIEAAKATKVHLIVGHSHSFDAPFTRTRQLIDSGEFGSVRMIAALNYTDFVYRPRRPEELVTSQGGGVIFSQAAHQVDVIRLFAGAQASSVRAVIGAWDLARPMDGAYAALLTFANGVAANLTYSGYGHFDSDEMQEWIGEMGQKKISSARGRPRPFFTAGEEAEFKDSRNYGGANYHAPDALPEAHQNFGLFIVGCEHADLRPMPNGVLIYRDGAGTFSRLAPPVVPRSEVIDELYYAVVNGVAPRHHGEWAMTTLEICLAMLRSSRDACEINLQ